MAVFPLLIHNSCFCDPEGLMPSSMHRVLGVHSADCCQCLCFSLSSLSHLSSFGKIVVYIIIHSYFQVGVSINGFLLNWISVINSIHGCLTPTPTVTLCESYSKGEGFPPTSTCWLLCPLSLWGPALSRGQHIMSCKLLNLIWVYKQ